MNKVKNYIDIEEIYVHIIAYKSGVIDKVEYEKWLHNIYKNDCFDETLLLELEICSNNSDESQIIFSEYLYHDNVLINFDRVYSLLKKIIMKQINSTIDLQLLTKNIYKLTYILPVELQDDPNFTNLLSLDDLWATENDKSILNEIKRRVSDSNEINLESTPFTETQINNIPYELLKKEQNKADKNLYLIEDDESNPSYTLIKIFDGEKKLISIQYYDMGLSVEYKIHRQNLLIRANAKVWVIDVLSMNIIKTFTFLTPVMEIITTDENLIFLCEIDIVCVTEDYKEKWSVTLPDQVVNYEISDNQLSVQLDNGINEVYKI